MLTPPPRVQLHTSESNLHNGNCAHLMAICAQLHSQICKALLQGHYAFGTVGGAQGSGRNALTAGPSLA
jgi:hypothetical protein